MICATKILAKKIRATCFMTCAKNYWVFTKWFLYKKTSTQRRHILHNLSKLYFYYFYLLSLRFSQVFLLIALNVGIYVGSQCGKLWIDWLIDWFSYILLSNLESETVGFEPERICRSAIWNRLVQKGGNFKLLSGAP